MGNSGTNKNQGDGYDDRFRLELDDEIYLIMDGALREIDKLIENRPLAALRLCLKMVEALKLREKKASFRANSRYKISWVRIGESMRKNSHWAYDRYVIGELSHERSRKQQRRQSSVSRTFTSVMSNGDLTEEAPSEMEE